MLFKHPCLSSIKRVKLLSCRANVSQDQAGCLPACVCARARVYIRVCLFDKDTRAMQRSAPLTNTSLLRSCRLCSAETFAGQTAATTNNEKQLCAEVISPKNHGWDRFKLRDAFLPAEHWVQCQSSLEGSRASVTPMTEAHYNSPL